MLFLAANLVACGYLSLRDEPILELTSTQQQLLKQRHDFLAPLHQWNLSARLSIRKDDEVVSGKIRWQHSSQQFLLQFNGLLASGGLLQIKGDQEAAEMRLADGQVYTADDPDSLFIEQTGLAIPLIGLQSWVVGIPTPGDLANIEFDNNGRIRYLRQLGWDIKYQRYQSVDNIDLPRKITMVNGDLSIRMLIDRWGIGN